MSPLPTFDWVAVAARRQAKHLALALLLVVCATADATTITYTYDEHGRLETSSQDNGTNAKAVTYDYDNAGNRKGATSATFDSGKPSVPTGLTTTVVSHSQVNLTWNASTDTGGSGLAGYRIYRGGAHIGTTSSTSYSDTTVLGLQTYTYRVAAYDYAQNLSDPSAAASATTPQPPDATPPSVPTSLTGNAPSSSQVNLSWSPSTDTGGSGLAGYRVFRNGTQIGTSTTNSYTDGTTSGSTQYTYRVAAYDGMPTPNVSGQSGPFVITTPDTLAPTVPTGLTVSAPQSTQVNISWNASSDPGGSGVGGYRVFRNGSQIGTTSTTSFSDTTTLGSTYYTYSVDAYDNAPTPNRSAQTNAVGVTTPDTIKPSVPTGLNNNPPVATQVVLYWNGSTDTGGSGMAGYKVYRNGVYIGAAATLTYTDTTTSANTTYNYTVTAYDHAGNESNPSAVRSVTTPTAYISITAANSAILPEAQGRYSWHQECGLLGGAIPYCDHFLIKNGVGTVWYWQVIYQQTTNCPDGSGATGYQQIPGTCVIQALPSVY